MAKNVNKVVVDGAVKLDLSKDSVTANTLAKGATAHDKSGAPIVGTMTTPQISVVGSVMTIA